MTDIAPNVLPCPWCQNIRVQASPHLNQANMKMWRAKCMNCGAGGPVMNEAKEALDSWNKRNPVIEDLPVNLPVLPEKIGKPIPEYYKVRLEKLEAIAAVARRHREIFGVCMCAGDLKCVHCMLQESLAALVKIKGD